jgi:hypothetical protein
MTIIERADAIGKDWCGRMDELVFKVPNEFYLFPLGKDGLSDGAGEYQVSRQKPHATFVQRLSKLVHHYLIAEGSLGARFFGARLKPKVDKSTGNTWRHGLWYKLLEPSTLYREATLGCVSCGDCLQDHLNYAGCSMRWCYKELRNGPCGGSRLDGSCEARPEIPCIWNVIYLGSLAMGDDPKKFARTLVPPRNWCLDRTNALANRMVGLDNVCKRINLQAEKKP